MKKYTRFKQVSLISLIVLFIETFINCGQLPSVDYIEYDASYLHIDSIQIDTTKIPLDGINSTLNEPCLSPIVKHNLVHINIPGKMQFAFELPSDSITKDSTFTYTGKTYNINKAEVISRDTLCNNIQIEQKLSTISIYKKSECLSESNTNSMICPIKINFELNNEKIKIFLTIKSQVDNFTPYRM